jgi:putative SOS response-associated peptidase YedK
MCGRFVASRPVEDIADILDVDDVEVPEELLLPRFNISPQAGVLAVANRRVKRPEGEEAPAGDATFRRRLTVYQWGLVPSWSKDPAVGHRSFNARAETIAEKPAFRTALAKRRCLVPADAFYEWQKLPAAGGSSSRPLKGSKGVARLPWCFRPADGGLLVFAGLWEAWRAPRTGAGGEDAGSTNPTGGEHDEVAGWHDDWLLSCSIITTSANDIVATLHDRMPVVLQPSDHATWLEPTPLDPGELGALLSPPPDGYLTGYRVGLDVNNSRLDGPRLVEPLTVETEDASDRQPQTLFDLPG